MMEKKMIHITTQSHPYFYHPVKILFLDDNSAFLDSLELAFSHSHDMITFTEHEPALNAIKENTGIQQNPNFFDIIYQQNRFNKIAIIVIDYQMPEVNGIEFCRKIKNKNIFKIMLTAEADKDTAIQAFNEGIIHQFILKQDKNLHSLLNKAIIAFKNRYFIEQAILKTKHSAPKIHADLLHQTIDAAHAIEYYLIDSNGSFLLLDKYGNPTWLIIKREKELAAQIDLLEGYEAPASLIQPIQSRKKMLALISDKQYKEPLHQWKNYLFDAQKYDTHTYYSIIQQNENILSLNRDKVISYSAFKETASL